jgi:hypothetical protein
LGMSSHERVPRSVIMAMAFVYTFATTRGLSVGPKNERTRRRRVPTGMRFNSATVQIFMTRTSLFYFRSRSSCRPS